MSFEPKNGEKYALGVQKTVQIHSSENGKVERTLDHEGRVQTLGFFSVSTILIYRILLVCRAFVIAYPCYV